MLISCYVRNRQQRKEVTDIDGTHFGSREIQYLFSFSWHKTINKNKMKRAMIL